MNLDEKELAVLRDSHFMPLKARVCQKVEQQLADLLVDLKEEGKKFSSGLHPDILRSNGKLSKGENYRTYAYRVLDYPKVLTKDDMFLYRSMMLWGDAFSIHVILAGKFLELYGETLLAAKAELPSSIYLAKHRDPWTWHQGAEGWLLMENLDQEEIKGIQAKRAFLKLSYFHSLGDYASFPSRSLELFARLMTMLKGGS